ALDALRTAAAGIDAAAQTVASDAPARRRAALTELDRFADGALVAPALTELRAVHARRLAEEQEAAAATEAARAIETARAAFAEGRRDQAIAALASATEPSRVAAALAALRDAASAIDAAAQAVKTGDQARRESALADLAK